MSKTYVGIDPGSKGFISVQKDGQFQFFSIANNDLYQLSTIFAMIRESDSEIACVIEDVQAIYGSSAKATFSFGFNKGYLFGLLAANRLPYVAVNPKVWQKEIWTNADKVYLPTIDGKKKVDTKNTSIKAAKRLFPLLDFRKTTKCKNLDDNKVDATLMSEYARRLNL